ncbi:MAG TPA: triphosphoribosyl-dephospho-CoA synthase [Gemmatimonadales bacterium]|nr:triphosphoribosyl-dephospho-CoA synthase [Gemmatimonadales bacterium]
MRAGLDPEEVTAAAQLACLLEASAPKPGNVTPTAGFHDARYEDYLASAIAIGPAIGAAGERPLGATIRAAVAATRRAVPANTNLGIVLLFAPLARAALQPGGEPLRTRLAPVLATTTVLDAREAYAAIRLASPGGLGRTVEQDVACEPTVTLRDAMALAAERDAIAREYLTDFATTFEVGHPALRRARAAGLGWSDATLETYLTLLAAAPDTHIARKLGAAVAADVQGRARIVLERGGVRTPAGRDAIAALDGDLRDPRNTRNPGATADLTAAALFVALLEDGWRRGGAEGAAHGQP